MSDKVFIYTNDKYGNPGPYFTTLEDFKQDLESLARDTETKAPQLWGASGDITDDDGDVVLVEATLETVLDNPTVQNPHGYPILFDLAKGKVEASEALIPHVGFILADWTEGDDHWRWVIEASEEEILDWAPDGV